MWPVRTQAPSPSAAGRLGPGGVGPHVGAALLLGHAHAREGAGLLPGGDAAGVVGPGHQPGLPLGRQVRCPPQRGDDRVGHRHRAPVSRLDLGPGDEPGGPGHVGAGRRDRPGGRVEAVADGHPHQLVVGGVVGDVVDPVAVAVVGAQLGRVPVGVEPPGDGLGRPGQPAEGGQVVDGPARALPLGGLDQGGVGREHVVALQRRRLVGDLVRGHGTHGAPAQAHRVTSTVRLLRVQNHRGRQWPR